MYSGNWDVVHYGCYFRAHADFDKLNEKLIKLGRVLEVTNQLNAEFENAHAIKAFTLNKVPFLYSVSRKMLTDAIQSHVVKGELLCYQQPVRVKEYQVADGIMLKLSTYKDRKQFEAVYVTLHDLRSSVDIRIYAQPTGIGLTRRTQVAEASWCIRCGIHAALLEYTIPDAEDIANTVTQVLATYCDNAYQLKNIQPFYDVVVNPQNNKVYRLVYTPAGKKSEVRHTGDLYVRSGDTALALANPLSHVLQILKDRQCKSRSSTTIPIHR